MYAIILFFVTVLKKLVSGFARVENESKALTYPCHDIMHFPLINWFCSQVSCKFLFEPFMETIFPWFNSLCEYLSGFQTEYVLFISCMSFIFTDELIINYVIYDIYVYMWLVYFKISQIGWKFIFYQDILMIGTPLHI